MIQLPLFEPVSTWKEPSSLPSVPSGVVLAVDTETKDNGLAGDRGPGWATKDGHIVGVSVAWNQEAHYIPLRHPDTSNLDPERTMAWLQDAMDRASRTVFHNSGYDAGWLGTEGVVVDFDKSDDTQYMSVMLDENQLSYSLDACCRREGVPGKDEAALREAAAAFGIDPKKDMWKLPAKYVAPYAAQDASATLGLYKSLTRKIDEEELTEAYRLEMDLVPMFLEMRRRGVRINESEADRVQKSLRLQRDALLEDTRQKLGWRRKLLMDDMNSAVSLEQMFDAEGVSYPRTPKTKKGSFKSDWMSASDHWLPNAVTQARQLNDLAEKFIGTYVLGSTHLGRIHAEIHQLRDDDGGTRSYRLSYANPPLQQIPARTSNGRLIRSIFEAEKDQLWYAADYSQQEPRMAVHFASLCKVDGAEEAVRYYCDDPAADFHTMVAELTGLTRKQAKIINLGLMYGMGLAKLAHSLGVRIEEAQEIVNQYNSRMPFVKKLNDFCEGRAETRGFIKLLDGARCRFDLWELAWRGGGAAKGAALPREKALEVHKGKRIKRAHTRKAMNRLIQGSSARQTKMAMRQCHREGYIPLLQMHDELDFPIGDPKVASRVCEIMSTIVKLKIPMNVDGQYGWTWGQASEEMEKGVVPPTFEELMKYGRTKTNMEIVRSR